MPEHHDLVLAHHQPCAAPDRVQHCGHGRRSRNRHAERGHQIFRQRISRFYPHRRLRSRPCGATFLNNRDAVLEMLGRFNEDLAALQRAVRWGDGETLFKLFTRTRAIRRSIIEAGQDTPEPNFGRLPHTPPR